MDRKCPLCEQIVPSHVKGVEIVNLGKRKVFHQGCARLIAKRYSEVMEDLMLELSGTPVGEDNAVEDHK